jgi:4-hydroxyphenylacetate 3-monooxygenase
MTRRGDGYVRGLRDGRVVLFDGERVADVTTHPALRGAGDSLLTMFCVLPRKPPTRTCT